MRKPQDINHPGKGTMEKEKEKRERETPTLGLPSELGNLLGARQELTVDVELSASSGDQMGVLFLCQPKFSPSLTLSLALF